MNKESKMGLKAGASAGPSVSSRRSPRITLRREPNFTKTESPLVKCQLQEGESESHTAKNIKNKATKGDDLALAEKPTTKNSLNNPDGHEKHPRRSNRCKSPVTIKKSFKPDAFSLVKLESQINDKRKAKDTSCLSDNTKTLSNGKSDDATQNSVAAHEYDVTQRSTEETDKTDSCINDFHTAADRSNKTCCSSSDSLQVRELKKLEDYWTRKSPVSEQSPRLRSSAKTNSNQTSDISNQRIDLSKEVDVSSPNRAKPGSNNVKVHDSENTEVSLPESPVPRRISRRLKINESKSTTSKEIVSGVESNKLITKDSFLRYDKNERLKPSFLQISDDKAYVCSNHTNHNSHQIKDSPDLRTNTREYLKTCENPDIKKPSPRGQINTRLSCRGAENANRDKESYNFFQDPGNCRKNCKSSTKAPVYEQGAKTNIISLTDAFTDITVKEYADSDSDDDDDYIPPRKKLRSEVTTDELWEGFPLTFSFKRLAPIQKEEQYNCSAKPEDIPSTSAETLHSNMTFEPKQEALQQLKSENKQENNFAFYKECAAIKPAVQIDPGESSNLENSHVVNANKQNTTLIKGDESQKEIGATVSTETTDSEVSLPVTNPKQKVSSDFSTNDEKTKPVPKRKRYSISPNMTLKRSSRLLEKYGITPEKDTCVKFTVLKQPDVNDNDREQPQTSTKHTSKHVLEVKKSTTKDNSDTIYDSRTTEVQDETNKDGAIKMEYSDYTRLKDEKKKDMSILEILTHDYSEQISSMAITNPKITSDDISCDTTCTENLDSESEEDKYAVTIVQTDNASPTECNFEQQENSATESVSYTLSELLDPHAEMKTDNRMKNLCNTSINKTPVSDDSFDASPIENILIIGGETPSDIREQNHKNKNHRDNSDCKINDAPYVSPACSSSDKHAIVDIEKLIVPKDMQDTKFIYTSASTTENKIEDNLGSEKIKRKVPPLRIKLKPKNSQSKKKKSNKKTNKIPIVASTAVATVHEITADNTNDATSSCRDEGTKPKNNTPSHTESNVITQQEKTQTTSEQKNKRPKKPVSKRRKSSPNASCMELRLNNERRQSIADDMLTNPMLDKHACVIWSSENRRHIVLSKPDSTHDEIDDILRHKWEALSKKEKLRYFIRAKNAIKDENRHSNRNHVVPKPAEPTPSTSSDPNPPLTKFLMMDSNQQLSELKKWLHFYHEVSLEEYNKVLAAFKESLQAAKVEKEKLREKETNKNKSSLKSKKKTRTQVKQSKELYDFDTQSEYRKLLFEKIFTVKDKIIQIWKENREHRKNMLKETFSGVVKKLITGDNVKFSGNVVSGRLTEVLCDIKNLEIDRKLGVSGELQSDSFVDLTNKLKNDTEQLANQTTVTGQDGQHGSDQLILTPATEGDLPQLNPASVQDVLDEISAGPSSNYDIYGRSRARSSPSSMLTSWVINDLLDDQAAQENVQRNTNNNRSQTTYTYDNREFRSILNLEDIQRKYGAKVNLEQDLVSDSKAESGDMPTTSAEKENNARNLVKAIVPQNRIMNKTNPYILPGSRSGIIAVQHYDNGKPVVRFARVKPSAHSAAQIRLMNQRQKLRFSPQLRFMQAVPKSPDIRIVNTVSDQRVDSDHVEVKRELNDEIKDQNQDQE